MERHSFSNDGLTFSYLDSGGELPPIVALHAHWMEGATFIPLAEVLASEWRIIALDQRGHGYSDHARTYSREDYLADMDRLMQDLRFENAVLLGNSLGGVNAYQYAARHPARVKALIIEDIGVELSGNLPPMEGWDGTYSSSEELERRIGPRMAPYLKPSFRCTPTGWKLAFDPRDMIASQSSMAGTYWNEWCATTCPALIVRGSDSRVTTAAEASEMVARRPNTQLVTLRGGHVLHDDDPQAFADVVRAFLRDTLTHSGWGE